MKCPKCEEGELTKIKFKESGKFAQLCDFCEAVWFDNEIVAKTTGHTLRVYFRDKEHEFDELPSQDQDHQLVKPTRQL